MAPCEAIAPFFWDMANAAVEIYQSRWEVVGLFGLGGRRGVGVVVCATALLAFVSDVCTIWCTCARGA